MLVLSREPGETIVIGGVVKVTIVEVKGRKVRVGIEAPREVTVHREEIENRIKSEKGGQIPATE